MSYFELCDQESLKKIADGDEIAFRQLFNQYHNQLGRYIMVLTNSVEMAEEVVQDVFLKIWMNRSALRSVKNFNAYLFVISKNHALNCLKKQFSIRMGQKQVEESYSQIFEEDASLNDCYELIDEAIDRLPTQQRKVYLLSRHERLKYAEIAEVMHISHETVKKYLQIANISIVNHVKSRSSSLLFLTFMMNFI
ncbi:RNA polymerase sigma-70 factor [Mucilaginibacter lacusdianchii]|uniref:RNA polymerase sigma-70 factor n=1 Tax=Mucilaginibacter lacusdianchii TaxID=2684211 RepID=UPI00131DA4F0|nr:RNA polymerase sigma-70 factor [Mucilaginibacter sp. JXJ CY 39]